MYWSFMYFFSANICTDYRIDMVRIFPDEIDHFMIDHMMLAVPFILQTM